MKILPATPQAIDEALAILAGGGVIVHATETCYGITCDLTNPAAVRKLFAIKRRPLTQPVSALFASMERAGVYVEWPGPAMGLARRHFPGPLTLVVPLKPGAPKLYPAPEGEHTTLGVRVSSHPIATEIASRHPVPVSTTSANISGMPEAYVVSALLKQFGTVRPDLVIDGGMLPKAPPSTVARVEGDTVTVIRQGALRVDTGA